MSARNMVRDLRENGALQQPKPPSAGWMTTLLMTVVALSAGVAIAYVGATFVVPGLRL